MAQYIIQILLETERPVNKERVKAYAEEAVGTWGGQYHPDDELFSTRIVATALTVARLKK